MIKHPLHSDELIARLRENGDTLQRCTGRSTIIALKAITRALENPGYWVKLEDHHRSPLANRHLANMVADLVTKLDFKHFILEEVISVDGSFSDTFSLVFGYPVERNKVERSIRGKRTRRAPL